VIVDLYLLDGTAQSVSESQWNMSAEVKKEIALEIAHVLFIDIVGYLKLSINEQNAAVVHNETLSNAYSAQSFRQRRFLASRCFQQDT
jgi:hypothetical protein